MGYDPTRVLYSATRAFRCDSSSLAKSMKTFRPFVSVMWSAVFEELMRAALQIHRDVQSVDIAGFVFDLDLQQFFLRKDFFHNLSAQRQTRRFALEPLVFLK